MEYWQELKEAVKAMRNAQKAYEGFKNGDTIREKRKKEHEVDVLLKQQPVPDKQQKLF